MYTNLYFNSSASDQTGLVINLSISDNLKGFYIFEGGEANSIDYNYHFILSDLLIINRKYQIGDYNDTWIRFEFLNKKQIKITGASNYRIRNIGFMEF